MFAPFIKEGFGLHTGCKARVVVEMGLPGSGVVFLVEEEQIPARPEFISHSHRLATVLAGEHHTVATVEHLLAALVAYGERDVRITLEGPEIPILDGSALPYARALEERGIPYDISGGGAFNDSKDLLHFVNLLTAVVDPEDQVALVATLRGSFYGVSDDLLYRFKKEGGVFSYLSTQDKCNDKKILKLVELDETCRIQQVNEECFDTLDDVPREAFTLTIPVLMNADFLFCDVPGSSKSEAIYNALNGPVSTKCPASILQNHSNCKFYFDEDSYSYTSNELKKLA